MPNCKSIGKVTRRLKGVLVADLGTIDTILGHALLNFLATKMFQEGALCAQHCLNALLQGHYFTAVDLADIARQLDEKEREQMAEGGTDTEGYKMFLEQPSSNYDDSGFFSVQVIQTALKIWALELTPYKSQSGIAQQARQDPTTMQAYICNFGEHWLTIRKLGNQWFNLNSLLTGPELISDTFLSMFLTQLQQDGYSIFIVAGHFTECEADQLLRLTPAVQPIKPQLINQKQNINTRTEEPGEGRDEELEMAIKESQKLNDANDQSLRKALQLSIEGYIEESLGRIDSACADCDTNKDSDPTENRSNNGPVDDQSNIPVQGTSAQLDLDDVRRKRLAFLSKMDKTVDSNPTLSNGSVNDKEKDITNCDQNGANGELSEEEMLKQAIAMSMSQDMD